MAIPRELRSTRPPPSAVRTSTSDPGGAYVTGRIIDISVAFDEPVVVRGAPWIELAGGGPPLRAVYESGNNTDELAFAYTVRPGDDAAGGLGRGGNNGISLGGAAAIEDAAGNGASLTLPDLGLEETRVIGGMAPLLFPADRATDNSGNFVELAGAIDVAPVPLGAGSGGAGAGSGTLVAVASADDDGVQLVRVRENGTLKAVDSIEEANDPSNLELDRPRGVDAFRLSNGSAYAIVSSAADDGVQLVRVHENGTLKAVDSIEDANDPSNLQLDGPRGIDAFRLSNGSAYAIVSSAADDGVQLVRVHEDGTLAAPDALADSSGLTLSDATGVSAFRAANGTVLAVVTSQGKHGVQLVRVDGDGTLAPAGSLLSGDTVLLRRAVGIDTIRTASGSAFAIVTSAEQHAAQAILIDEDGGTLEARGNIRDDHRLNLRNPLGVAAFGMGGHSYALATSRDDDGVQLLRIYNNGTLEAAGAARDGRGGFKELDGARGVKVFETAGNRTFAIVAARHDNGVQLVRLSPPFVTGVTSAMPDAAYPAGRPIEIRVGFSEPVAVSGPLPFLLLAPGSGTARAAEYLSGNGTDSLVFRYAAQPGDGSGRLAHVGPAPLATRGAVTDLAAAAASAADSALTTSLSAADALPLRASGPGNALLPYVNLLPDYTPFPAADLGIPAHDSLGSARAIEINTEAAAYVANVSSLSANGTYGPGQTIDIAVRFSVPVDVVGGMPVLALATAPPRNATYASGSGTADLVFRYAVQKGDRAANLDYATAAALALNGGVIRDSQGGEDAVLGLPAPGTAGSLGHTKDIAIDSVPPSVISVGSPDADGTYGTGRIVNITVAFDKPVLVAAAASGGAPALGLATTPPRNATYASGNGTDELTFLYTVQPGDEAADLDYGGVDALRLNGATIMDMAGNLAADPLPLPAPGSPESLAARGDISIYGLQIPVLAASGSLGHGGALTFNKAHGVASFELEGRTYAAVASADGDAVQLLRVHGNGTLRDAGSIGVAAAPGLDDPVDIDALTVGNRTYVAASSWQADGVQLIHVHANGTVSAGARAADSTSGSPTDFNRLDGSLGVDVFSMNGTVYVIATAIEEDGVQLIRVHANGTLEAADSLADNSTLVLGGARGVDVFEMAVNRTHSGTYAIVASGTDDGVQLLRVHANGTLRPAGSLADAADRDGLELDGARGVDAFAMGNRTYAAVASYDDDGVQLLRVHANGTLRPAGSLADAAGLELDGAQAVDAFAMGNRTYAAVASYDDDGVQLVRVHENGALSAAGAAADDSPGFPRLDGAYGIAALDAGNRTYAIASSEHDDGVQLIRLSPASVTGVSSALPDGEYVPSHRIGIAVKFDEPVLVSEPPPSLLLAFDGGSRTAEYVSGSGTRSLEFAYTTQSGDNTALLEYAGPAALATRGIVKDAQAAGAFGAAAADLELPAPGDDGSLGRSASIAVNSSRAHVTDVSSPNASAYYVKDDAVDIVVRFSVPVVLAAGAPALELNTEPPRNATYASGGGTNRLWFRYAVQQGDNAADLDYASSAALVFDGAPAAGIRALSDGLPAGLALPPPGGPGSLGHSNNIAIDAAPPQPVAVSSPVPDGTYGTGRILNITVAFGEPIVVVPASSGGGGAPALELNTEPPRNATYASGSGTDTLSFLYAVRQGDSADDLDYAGTGALRLNGAAVVDRADNTVAAVSLPGRGTQGSLSASKDIAILGAELPVLAPGGSTAAAGTLEFASAHRPAAFEAGGRTYAVVTSYGLDAALLLRVHENGTLEALDQIGDAGDRSLTSAIGVAAFEAGDGTYAVVGPRNEPGVQLLRVHPGNGTLTAPYRLADTADRALNGAIGVDAFRMGNRTYAIAASLWDDGGVQLMEAHPGNDTLGAVSRIVDSTDLILGGAAAVAAFEMGDTAYAAVASSSENGVQLVRIHENGAITANAGHKIADNATLALRGPLDLDILKAGNRTYAIVAASGDDGVQLVRIRGNGALEAAGTLAEADDPAGLELDGPHGVGAFGMGNRTYAVVAARGDDGVQLVRIGGDGRLAPAGSAGDSAALPELEGAHGVDVFLMAGRAYALVASAEDDGVQLIRLSPASVTGVSPSLPAVGAYPAGHRIGVVVEFDEPVSVSGPPPSLLLALDGGRSRTAEYVSGSGTRSLEFAYTAKPGDDTARLDYAGTGALTTLGIVSDMRAAGASGAADLELPDPGSPGSLGSLDIGIDTVAPSALGAYFLNGSGAYGAGSNIRIAVEFDEDVFVAGRPRLALDTMPPANATYLAGSGSDTLVFLYLVRDGDMADSLGYAGRAALSAAYSEAAAIRDEAGNDARLALPDPNLLDPSGIRLSTRAPSALGVTFLNESGAYGAGSNIRIAVEFDEDVFVAGQPLLALDTVPPASAVYSAGSGSDTLVFLYVVRDGDRADPLGYAGRAALSSAYGEAAAIRDELGNRARLALPDQGPREARDPAITIDGIPPAIDGAEAVSLDTVLVTFAEPVESRGGAAAGWSISGPDAAGLAVASGSFTPPPPPSKVLTLALDGRLRDTAPDIALSYDAGTGGIVDEAGNELPGSRGMTVDDRMPPEVASSLIVESNAIEIRYTEPVDALSGAYHGLVLGGVARALTDVSGNGSDAHRLAFAPAAELGANGTLAIGRAAVLDGADRPNRLGGTADDLVLAIHDGRILAVASSRITGPGTAVVEYTRDAAAQPGYYESLVVDGAPRIITGLGGGGTRMHELAFSPGGAPPNATGSVAVDIPDLRGGARTLALADGQRPAVLDATAVSGADLWVVLSEPIVPGGASASASAAGWSMSGPSAEGLNVSAAAPVRPPPSTVLSLSLDGDLRGGTAPAGATLLYDPDRGDVADPAGNELADSAARVGDGIAPEIESATVSGPNNATVIYSELVHAPPAAYKSVSLSVGGGPRPAAGIAGSGTASHTIVFGGGAAPPWTEGILRMNATAVRDAAGNVLGPEADVFVRLAGGQAPALPPAPPPGHASVERAVFTARNEATVSYSGALDRPAGHAGYAYESVMIAGEDGPRPVTGEEGLGTAVHTVRFGGAGVGADLTGTVALAVGLEGAVDGGSGQTLRLAATTPIQIAPGRILHTVILSQEQPGRVVAIEPGGFTRAVDATAAGPGARPAIDVTALAVGGGGGGGAPPSGTVRFPAEAVSLAALFTRAEFPPNAMASHVPPGGVIFLSVLPGERHPPIAAAVAAALGHADASGLVLRGIVEVAGGDGDGDGAPVVFDRPVRVFLEGQSGGRAFYINGSASGASGASGAAAPIDAACESDDAAAVHEQLGGSGKCQLDLPGAASGKAIYTYHLALFGTVRSGGSVEPVDPVEPDARPRPASVHALQRAGGDPLRAPVSYSAGDTIVVGVRFTAPVAVDAGGAGGDGGGPPYLELRTGSAGARAVYASGSGTETLEFAYDVRGGDIAARLSYAGTGALAANGAAITAAAGSGAAASVVLPEPGEPGSLSHEGSPAVRIDPEPGRPVLQVGILDGGAPGAGGISAAAMMAAERFNERQGLAAGALIVNATVYDAGTTAGSAAEALRAAHSSGAGPSVYVGPSTDRGLHAAMPYAAEHGIVLASAGSTASSLAVEGDRTFRMLPSARLEAEALARLALGGGAESLHAVLENATHGPPTPDGRALEDAVNPPQDRFSHAFDAALAYAGVPALEGTVTLEGTAGSYGAAAAAEALDASVRAGAGAPAAVVYMGSPDGLAAMAEASAGYPALSSAAWLATGRSAGSSLLAGGGPAAAFAAQAGLSAARWSLPDNGLARGIDALLPQGADAGSRHRAYAAYDAMLVVGSAASDAAASGSRGAQPDAAAVAGRIPDAAADHAGALGDIALDHAGDLWVPAKYDLWTVGRPAAGAAGAEWALQPSELDEERACSIALARAKIDYGPIDSGQTSRPHLQTIVNTGQLPFSRVDLTATPWHVDSPGGCAPGDSPSLPVGLSEIRTELGGDFLDLASSGTVLARGLEAGGQAPLWYRLSLAGYADLPQAQITQCATYVVRCG